MRTLGWILLAALALAGCGDGSDAIEPPPDEPATGSEEEPGAAPADTELEASERPEPGAGRTSPDGMCGGIAGFTCPEGQWCDMQADHPDASGTCRPEGTCDAPADCEQQGIPHAMCVGEWTCADGRCGWQCS